MRKPISYAIASIAELDRRRWTAEGIAKQVHIPLPKVEAILANTRHLSDLASAYDSIPVDPDPKPRFVT